MDITLDCVYIMSVLTNVGHQSEEILIICSYNECTYKRWSVYYKGSWLNIHIITTYHHWPTNHERIISRLFAKFICIKNQVKFLFYIYFWRPRPIVRTWRKPRILWLRLPKLFFPKTKENHKKHFSVHGMMKRAIPSPPLVNWAISPRTNKNHINNYHPNEHEIYQSYVVSGRFFNALTIKVWWDILFQLNVSARKIEF